MPHIRVTFLLFINTKINLLLWFVFVSKVSIISKWFYFIWWWIYSYTKTIIKHEKPSRALLYTQWNLSWFRIQIQQCSCRFLVFDTQTQFTLLLYIVQYIDFFLWLRQYKVFLYCFIFFLCNFDYFLFIYIHSKK